MEKIKKIIKIFLLFATVFAVLIVSAILFYGGPSSETAARQGSNDEVKWNTTNVNASENGNIPRAVNLLKNQNPTTATAQAANVLKRPWDYYGKYLCFDVTVEIADDYPPGSDMAEIFYKRSATEIVGTAIDGTIIDLMAQGSSGSLSAGSTASLCGYPVGRVEVPNQIGGKFTHLVLIGRRD